MGYDVYSRALYAHGDLETWHHLFFTCQFSSRCWNYLQIHWPAIANLEDEPPAMRRDFGRPFFVEVAIICCWNIWKQRNDFNFEAKRPSFRAWHFCFVADMTRLMHRPSIADAISSWLDNLC
ncbi:hypothetical protein BRADI_1g61725v3 [Brachypodium distachyon]|uniref:Reverse transcriptase zinc-binding domain-containing protein n=1 Tax=Brachypodium distachyon TaxID=15368 RepID=A0A2K2DSW4_BRADI|nr:hypothetical protein BRADI_1g61725v3 [Brachypodium distachyon]